MSTRVTSDFPRLFINGDTPPDIPIQLDNTPHLGTTKPQVPTEAGLMALYQMTKAQVSMPTLWTTGTGSNNTPAPSTSAPSTKPEVPTKALRTFVEKNIPTNNPAPRPTQKPNIASAGNTDHATEAKSMAINQTPASPNLKQAGGGLKVSGSTHDMLDNKNNGEGLIAKGANLRPGHIKNS